MTLIRLPTVPSRVGQHIIWNYNLEYVGQGCHNDKAKADVSPLA